MYGCKALSAAALAVVLASATASAGEIISARLNDGRGMPMTYRVYIPTQPHPFGRHYPVVYLLHGYGASGREWIDGLDLVETLDAMIEASEIAPLIAVMPDAGKSWYVDSAMHGGPGDYESALASRLIEDVDRRFLTLADRDARAIAGLSMGGYGALRLAFKYPDRFGAVAALSAGLFHPDGISWEHGPGGRRWESRDKWYARSFGAPFSLAAYNEASPFAYLPSLQDAASAPDILLVAGDDDEMGAYDGTVEMFLELRRIGLKPELRIGNGGHNHRFWRSMLKETFSFLDQALRAPGL